MRSTTAAGRVLAVGLMVLFSLALAGQSAWGAETSTKARPDKQGACSYNKNPGAVSLAKAGVELEGARLSTKRTPKGENGGREGIHMSGMSQEEEDECLAADKDCKNDCWKKWPDKWPWDQQAEGRKKCIAGCTARYWTCIESASEG